MMSRRALAWFAVVAAVSIAVSSQIVLPIPKAAATAPVPDVGIWYSTWYADLPTLSTSWATGFGGSSINQFVGDVNGDGIDDAVTFNSGGTWNVALSTGTGFATPSTWITGHGTGSTSQFLADVNGDGKADAVVYFNSDVNGDGYAGDWYVALSTGTGFAPYTLWKSGAGAGSTKNMLADVNGDWKADIVTYYGSTGTWAVAPSTGAGFGALSVWATGLDTGSDNQFVADANGDGKADAIGYVASTGNWSAADSSGSAFGASASWTSGDGAGSTTQLVSDGNGDGYAEPYVFFNADVGFPTGDGQPGDLVGREYNRATGAITSSNEVFNTGFGYNSTKYMQGNVTGDKYGWKASVAFYAGTAGGTWEVQRYRAADSVTSDTWLGFPSKPAIAYRPLTLGADQTYDSGDPTVIDEHINTISSAQIDFLLLDETNNLNVDGDYILDRAHTLAQRLAVHNAVVGAHALKYAFAIGGVQYSNDPLTIEQEAAQTWNEFANDPTIGGSNYYNSAGKPLLVVDASAAEQTAWANYTGDKAAANNFNIQWASYPTTAGEYGWELPSTGTVDNSSVMEVMPGWNNNAGATPVSRNNGLFYIQDNLQPILDRATPPSTVIINSFNEFAEETGVQTSDTSGLTSPSEKWTNTDGVVDDSMYWDLTTNFVDQLKHPDQAHRASAGFSSSQGGSGWSYQDWTTSGSTVTPYNMTWNSGTSSWVAASGASISSGSQTPAVGDEAVRIYTASQTGTATITGWAGLTTSGGDGVSISILKNGSQIWPTTGGAYLLTSQDESHLLTISLTSGDKLEFVADSGATSTDDTTTWDPTVTFG